MSGWVELHTHSNYSFLDGASDVDELTDAAVEQGLDALALTDTNGLYGAVRFANAAKERGLRPIFRAELQLQDMGHLVLIARDRQGWTSLCRTISAAQLAGKKTKPKATFELLAENASMSSSPTTSTRTAPRSATCSRSLPLRWVSAAS